MAVTVIETGLELRPYVGETDLVEIARLYNAEAAADRLDRRTSAEELAAFFGHPNASFDPARDVTLAELDGRVVGTAQREVVELLRGRGMTSAALGVDADNASGALGLYEGLGFEVDRRSFAWRKPIR